MYCKDRYVCILASSSLSFWGKYINIPPIDMQTVAVFCKCSTMMIRLPRPHLLSYVEESSLSCREMVIRGGPLHLNAGMIFNPIECSRFLHAMV